MLTEIVKTEQDAPASANWSYPRETGFRMTLDDVERFLDAERNKGWTAMTVKRYRSALERMYQDLPAEKQIQRGTLVQWREELLDNGFAPSGINLIFSACNKFLDFVGHRECQVVDQLPIGDKLQPELTRNEYLRLLQTAKQLEQERIYMLVKVFGSIGLRIQDLPLLTVEAVREGKLTSIVGSRRQTVRIPKCRREELLDYARRSGVSSGPIFVGRNGQPSNRSEIAVNLRKLGESAQIPAGKVTARTLRKLCGQTRANIEANMDLLVEQALERQLEQEELTVGWDV